MTRSSTMRAGADNDRAGLGERCIYMPNLGAYQGEGNLLGPCNFIDGLLVSGVTLYGYEDNGVFVP